MNRLDDEQEATLVRLLHDVADYLEGETSELASMIGERVEAMIVLVDE